MGRAVRFRLMADDSNEQKPGEKPPKPKNTPSEKRKKQRTPLHPHINEKKGEN